MRSYFSSSLVLFLWLLGCSSVCDAQATADNIVQINGIIMTADSLRAVPDVTVMVKNQNRGVMSEYTGVFSIVCYKGDTLQFSALGFRSKEYVISKAIQGQYFSLIQLMVQDTFFLPETIIRSLPRNKAFDYAFVNWQIPDDKYELARRNTDVYMLRALSQTLPKDGHEAQSAALAQQAREAIYYGMLKPQTIFNPIAWAEFFEAWKRGDFRKKGGNKYLSTKGY